MQLGLN